jgi:signal peptidase I
VIDLNESRAPVPPPTTTARVHKRRWQRQTLEWVAVVVVAVLVATGLRAFVVQSFYVPSGSMLPTLQIGDRIIVLKIGYTIHRGDIVVFRRTPADTDTADADLVKRVIGLPGETISSVGDTVMIDGRPLQEPWLPALTGSCVEAAENIATTKIPPDHYFMMGDCRGNSLDSRAWGTLPASYVVGKVEVIVWRFGHPYFHWF